MNRKVIKGLNSAQYEHPFDQKALMALKQTPGAETLVRKFNQNWNDKLFKIQYTGSNIKATKKNFPKIHDILIEACDILCISKIPDLYIKWGCEINAFTAGVEDPIIVLNSGAIDLLTDDELIFIIGHELGHIKSEHILYRQMAQVLPVLGEIIGSATLGIGKLISGGIQIALLNWLRMSEFTADRAGLLTCQDIQIASSAMVKLAGVPYKYFDSIDVDAFILQAREFEGYDYDALDRLAKIVSIMWQGHPWTVMRAAEFIKWTETGEYSDILNGTRRISMTNYTGIGYCKVCGNELCIDDKFCNRCGTMVNIR